MALAGCAVTIFVDICEQSKIELKKIEVVVEAEKKPNSPQLSTVDIKATVSANARKQLLEAAWRRTEANCPVLLIYRESISVNVELDIVE